jgi:transposase
MEYSDRLKKVSPNLGSRRPSAIGQRRAAAVYRAAVAASVSRPPWRPTLYRPEYCQKVIDFCAQGYSLTAFAGEIGVSRDCLTKWGKAHPDFLLAVGVAKAVATLWHEKHGLRIAQYGGAPGQAAMVMFYLRNLAPEEFGGKSRRQGELGSSSEHTTPEEALARFQALLDGGTPEHGEGEDASGSDR